MTQPSGVEVLTHNFPQLTDKQIRQFNALGPLYRSWNDRINVVSRKDIDSLYTHHILHALCLTFWFQFKPGTLILDAGTGGGIPGIPLAIMFPESRFHLVDSTKKKLTVVDALVTELELENVSTTHSRVEHLGGKYDFITARAFTAAPTVLHWLSHCISPRHRHEFDNGFLLYKGGDLKAELQETGSPFEIFHIADKIPEIPYYTEKKIVYFPVDNS